MIRKDPSFMLFSKCQRGFSLTELSVSMAIIAVVAGSALSVALTGDFYANSSQTMTKLDRIEEALAAFVANNKRLPCPADGAISSDDDAFGAEGTPTDAGCSDANFSSDSIYTGVVPVKTLQIPDDFMFDGWGRRITYAVDYRFANNAITNPDCDGATSTVCFIDTPATDAEGVVKDASGVSRTDDAIYVLISHGENGHGAFSKNGDTDRLNAYTSGNPWRNGNFVDELDNAHLDQAGTDTAYDTEFVARQFARDENTNSDYFDDYVRFKTKPQVIKAAGIGIANNILYDTICRQVSEIITNPVNACTGAANEGDCTNFANALYNRCL